MATVSKQRKSSTPESKVVAPVQEYTTVGDGLVMFNLDNPRIKQEFLGAQGQLVNEAGGIAQTILDVKAGKPMAILETYFAQKRTSDLGLMLSGKLAKSIHAACSAMLSVGRDKPLTTGDPKVRAFRMVVSRGATVWASAQTPKVVFRTPAERRAPERATPEEQKQREEEAKSLPAGSFLPSKTRVVLSGPRKMEGGELKVASEVIDLSNANHVDVLSQRYGRDMIEAIGKWLAVHRNAKAA